MKHVIRLVNNSGVTGAQPGMRGGPAIFTRRSGSQRAELRGGLEQLIKRGLLWQQRIID